MKKWEYMILDGYTEHVKTFSSIGEKEYRNDSKQKHEVFNALVMNLMGDEGWEAYAHESGRYYLKRPINE